MNASKSFIQKCQKTLHFSFNLLGSVTTNSAVKIYKLYLFTPLFINKGHSFLLMCKEFDFCQLKGILSHLRKKECNIAVYSICMIYKECKF